MLINSRVIPKLLMVLIAVGTAAGLYSAIQRFRVESRNRRVEMGVEYAEVNTLAQSSGHSLIGILRDMKAQGASAIILTEDTPATLESIGALHLFRAPDARSGQVTTTAATDTPETLQRIQSALTTHGIPYRFGAGTGSSLETRFTTIAAANDTASGFTAGVDYSHLRSLGLGLPPDAVQVARTAGLQIVGRITNFPGVTPVSARAVLRGIHNQGAGLVIFIGDEVLGYRGQEKSIAAMLVPGSAGTGVLYGDVEFGKQKGAAVLTHLLRGQYVRVHSVQIAEMGQMDENTLIDRYALAARERNIRFLYVRMLTQAGPDSVQQNVQFLKKIARRIHDGALLTAGGLTFGPARPFDAPSVPALLFALMGLGAAAGLIWMLREMATLNPLFEAGLLGVMMVIGSGSALSQGGRPLVALLAGIVFPAIACLRAFPRIESPPFVPRSSGSALARAALALATAGGITLLGIIHVVGLLASREYLVKAVQFVGIKAQHGVPIALIAFVALIGGVGSPGETWTRYRIRVTSALRTALNEPARYGMLLLSLFALGALLLILARTGNDSGVSVSGVEMKGRALLDRLLPVRPRTKEFLVGHPAFLLALAWWWRGRRRITIPCFVVGSIGQVSLLNTFCHLHTPLVAEVWRGGLGLLFGALLGAVLFILLETLLPPPDLAGSGLPDERFRDL